MKHSIKLWTLSTSAAIVVALSVSVAFAAPWSGPGSAPPDGNVDAPINVGGAYQEKIADANGNGGAWFDGGIGVDAGKKICFGVDCRTSWPVGGASQWIDGAGGDIYYNGGNVGIGTSDPSFKLEIVGPGNVQMRGTDGTGAHLQINEESVLGKGLLDIGANIISKIGGFADQSLNLQTYVNGGPLIIGVAGNTNPTYFYGSAWVRDNMMVGDISGTPADKLQVKGNIRVGTSVGNGCLKRYDGGTIIGTCSSDARLKNVTGNVVNVLDKMSALNLVTFHWNDTAATLYHNDTLATATGWIAQDVAKQFPELVHTDEHGYYTLDYTTLGLYTTEAVKELNAKVDAQQQQIDTLKAEIDALKK